ncbi:hypothetical protein EZS27_034822 [termite gut metagenome]|uniref:Uncharacterized protein n=1 Tax=termite gut metagenome TaxID=433724 RepID=A0A5J4PYG7_9ZZZZ
MEKLRKLLDLREVDVKNINQRFKEIANLLFQEYHIQKGENIKYDFLEIEFYYYTAGHEDIITYPRNEKSGRWFFHCSGVDITFESKCEDIKCDCKTRQPNGDHFGGILIRSLLKNEKERITGPQKCTWSLFDAFDAFELKQDDLPLIVKNETNNTIPIPTSRFIPIEEDKVRQRFGSNFDDFYKYYEKTYRYYIEHPAWTDIKKSEYIARPW